MTRKTIRDEIQILDEWFQSHCDGLWEHRYGLSIETCDNPGWQVVVSGSPISGQVDDRLCDRLRRDFGAEIVVADDEFRLFARSLRMCLAAITILLDAERKQDSSDRKKTKP